MGKHVPPANVSKYTNPAQYHAIYNAQSSTASSRAYGKSYYPGNTTNEEIYRQDMEKQLQINENLQKQINILKDIVFSMANGECVLLPATTGYFLEPYAQHYRNQRSPLTKTMGPFLSQEAAEDAAKLLNLGVYDYFIRAEDIPDF